MSKPDYDLFVIGGGINGCGIARDAAGRGLRVGLVEMNDLASATSSASTKLFHGGLRYLEYLEIRLVREALREREILLKMMPHISWPMRFVLPFHRDMRFEGSTPVSRIVSFVMPWLRGRRPAWMIRLGLFFYDRLGAREILPATKTLDLTRAAEGAGLNPKFKKAFEYSDCWVDDARLVVLNAKDAALRGADILVRTKLVSANRGDNHWVLTLDRGGDTRTVTAKTLVNCAGPWVEDVVRNRLDRNTAEGVRLVRGSHIVVDRIFDHEKAYFFQGTDGRIIFAIPYETAFTLIGTTDAAHDAPDQPPECTDAERDYLLDFINGYLATPLSADDVRWRYSGVRPLYDDGAATAAGTTRDFVLSLDDAGPAVLSVFGGKITSYRELAEEVLEKLAPHTGAHGTWTAGAHLPGGDFAVDDVDSLTQRLKGDYTFLTIRWAARLIRAYGTEAWSVLGDAKTATDLGVDLGADLTGAEVAWMMDHEFARTADDILWRRSKLGLHMTDAERAGVADYLAAQGGT